MSNATAAVMQSVGRLNHDHDFQRFREYLRAELKDAQAALMTAGLERVQSLQGKAQSLAELLALTESKASTPKGSVF